MRDRWGKDAQGRLTLRHWKRTWWGYRAGCYQPLDDDELASVLTAAIKREFDTRPVLDRFRRVRQVTRGLVGNVVNALRSLPDIQIPKEVSQPVWLGPTPVAREYLAVQNGLLDLRELAERRAGVLHAPTPEWFTLACLPYAYEPTATCPRWAGFLAWMFRDNVEVVRFLQEWFGYCLVADTSHHKFMAMVGEGANGKSVLLEVLKRLVGQENCSAVALEDFVERFALQPTIGKLVNVCAEIGQVSKLPEGKLKAFVGGDRMSFDRKFRDPLQVNPTARLVFATNQLPKFRDRSEGLWRRLIVVPCTRVVAPDQQDRQLAEKLCEELPGILNWALEGLARLRERSKFIVPATCQKAAQAHRRDSQPELQFFEECCEAGPKAEVGCGTLHQAYSRWSIDRYQEVMDSKQFGKALRKCFSKVDRARRRQDGKPVWVYTGVQLIP